VKTGRRSRTFRGIGSLVGTEPAEQFVFDPRHPGLVLLIVIVLARFIVPGGLFAFLRFLRVGHGDR
jgi:hypothetical protein